MIARRVIVGSVLVSVVIGVAIGLAAILMGRPSGEAGSALALLMPALLVSGPVSVPGGLLGGVIAVQFLKRQRSQGSAVVWITRGVGLGGVIGALAAPVLPLLAARSWSRGASGMAALFSFCGAVGGVLSGGLVGVWCYREQSRHTGGASAA